MIKSRPKFFRIGTVQLPIFRKSSDGYYSDGEWVEADADQTLTIKANVQPLKYSETKMFPESLRTKKWMKLITEEEVREDREGNNGWEADEFEWQGDRFKVMQVRNFAMGNLDHYSSLAVRIELTPN
jgi:hypothetical protein